MTVLLLLTPALRAGRNAEFHFNLGAIDPQGDYQRYADLGPTVNARLTRHLNRFHALAGWVNLNGSFFTSDKTRVRITGDPYISAADQTINEYAAALQYGVQVGSGNRQGLFRPYTGIGPGLYLFNTETTLDVPVFEDHYAQYNDTHLKFGWHAFGGADFLLSSKWGLSCELTYDWVYKLDHSYEYDVGRRLIQVSKTAKYFSFVVGVVIPFETLVE